jgi:acyl-[acyl-carrier-protein]-phospholipid O-acyltransferase/long-chain-fatty-acid--[acyl-carrier-protein] ligase
MAFDVTRTRRSLFDALLDARRTFGGRKEILEDADRAPLTYDKLVLGILIMGRKIAALTRPGETVGVMLANSNGAIVAVFGLSAFGRTPAMINFTAGPRNIRAACAAAQVTKIITARRFIEQAGLQELEADLAQDFEIIHLDAVKETISTMDKVRALAEAAAPAFVAARPDPDSPAVILFTSGTEGAPKGVALSHANLVANVEQTRNHVELRASDVVFNPLPVFHCFGLTGGTLLPILNGMKCVLYPSPLHVKIIPKLIQETKSTIAFATDTFLAQYIRAAGGEDFRSLRFVVCGAEKVKDETRNAMMSRWGVPIVEGYGATEASPIVAVNTPDANNRPGTVGRFLPGITWRLESVPGISGAGRLFVKGPNLMVGYLRVDAPGELQPLPGGWHDMGDIVEVDAQGYVTIRGRLKRFAKIGGEMVSLTAVEANASALWPEQNHVAIAVADPKKGEQIVLLTEKPDAARAELLDWCQAQGVAELSVPRKIIPIEAVPLLGTGKTDYVTAQKLAEAKLVKTAA